MLTRLTPVATLTITKHTWSMMVDEENLKIMKLTDFDLKGEEM